MNYDKILLELFLNPTGRSKKTLSKIYDYPNIKTYLDNRFNDYSSNYKEILDRIRFHIEIRPKCEVCGDNVKYRGLLNGIPTYKTYCSCSCAQKSEKTRLKYKENCIKKYGVDNTLKLKEIQEKRKRTLYKRYGVTIPSKSKEIQNKIKNTCKEKYGVENPLLSSKIRDKIKETCIDKYGSISVLGNSDFMKSKIKEKYGVEYVTQIPYVRKRISESTSSEECNNKKMITCIKKYGVPFVLMSDNVKKKIMHSKKINHTFNTSKPEEELYIYIKDKFPNVKRQYKDEKRYPYNCDFYIPELDYFIELEGSWVHGSHPYNDNEKIDKDKLAQWTLKYNNGSKYYKNAIDVWTIKDPEKRQCANIHNLNFKEVWSLNEGKSFIDNLYKQYEI